ncbi:MAG: TolC family protein [Marinilabiliaceae bacterium]|nr:TolC family protein [Marinilabiliaceae bacterium]
MKKIITTLTFVILGTALFAQQGLTLEAALNIAEDNSPDIKQTRLSLERSRENLNAQRASLKSNFSLSINPFEYSNNREFLDFASQWNNQESIESSGAFTVSQPIVATDARVSLTNSLSWRDVYSEYNDARTTGFNNNLFLNINQPIFTYNRTKMAIRELELALENSQLNYAIQRLMMERYVAQSFYSVYQQQQSLEISDEAYKNMQKSYGIIKNKVDAGLSAREELFQAELNLATSRSDFENSIVNLENAKDDFKLLIGMSLYDDVIVIPDISVDTVDVDIAFAIDRGLENRMELRQREIDIENAEFNLIQTEALNEFKGEVNLSLGLFGDNEAFSKIYETPRNNQTASLSFQIPLYDWGEKKSRIRAAEISIESQKLNLSDEENNIIINIRKVYRNLSNLKNQIQIAEQNVINAQLTYDLNLERYENGDLTGMDLNIYQNQLSEKRLSHTNSLISYKLELLNLKIQTLYDFESDSPVSPVTTIENK